MLTDEILDNLHLGCWFMLDRPDINTLHIAQALCFCHASVSRKIKEGIVHGFWNDSKAVLIRCTRSGCQKHGKSSDQQQLFHENLPKCNLFCIDLDYRPSLRLRKRSRSTARIIITPTSVSCQ